MPIRKRGARWQVRVSLGSGRRAERTLPAGATRADALAVETQIRRAQIDNAAGKRVAIPLDALLDRWIAEEASRQKSWQKSTRFKVGVLREYTAGRTIDQIADVAAAIRKVDAQPATLNRYLSILRRLANLALQWNLTDKAQRIRLLPEHNARHVYLTAAEVESIARRCAPEVADAVRLSAMTGLRRGELLGLTAASLRDGAIMLTAQTKSGRPRVIPLPSQALQIAATRIPFRVTVSTLRNDFERARKAAGLAHVRWHDLRHTYASFLAAAGVGMIAIRDLLGHSSLTVTDRYAHLARDDLRRAVAGAFHGSGMGQAKRRKARK